MRKPVVEKMRRDRINSCIDQLKVILEKEFHKQEPNSKLEKADILEMTVSFLRQQLQLQPGLFSQGFSHCWRDSVHFLSQATAAPPPPPPAPCPQSLKQQEQLRQSVSPGFSTVRPTRLQERTSSSSSGRDAVWRPW